jgi:hypothetical protein
VAPEQLGVVVVGARVVVADVVVVGVVSVVVVIADVVVASGAVASAGAGAAEHVGVVGVPPVLVVLVVGVPHGLWTVVPLAG